MNEREKYFYNRGFLDASGYSDRRQGETSKLVLVAISAMLEGDSVVFVADNYRMAGMLSKMTARMLEVMIPDFSLNLRENKIKTFFNNGSIQFVSKRADNDYLTKLLPNQTVIYDTHEEL